ncbi:MAG TPA: antitoxin [Ornithinicoccus sp.]|jgi:hypothetical protein|nr:antitoxin [Ornithinicoccus sp.]
MGLMDKFSGRSDNLRDKAGDAVDQHSEKIDEGIERGGEFASEKTGGKHDEHIDQGSDKLREGLDSLDGQQDDFTREERRQ